MPYSGFAKFSAVEIALATPGPTCVCVHAMNTPSVSVPIASATAGLRIDINSIFIPIKSTLITTARFSPSSKTTAVARSGSRTPFAYLLEKYPSTNVPSGGVMSVLANPAFNISSILPFIFPAILPQLFYIVNLKYML